MTREEHLLRQIPTLATLDGRRIRESNWKAQGEDDRRRLRGPAGGWMLAKMEGSGDQGHSQAPDQTQAPRRGALLTL